MWLFIRDLNLILLTHSDKVSSSSRLGLLIGEKVDRLQNNLAIRKYRTYVCEIYFLLSAKISHIYPKMFKLDYFRSPVITCIVLNPGPSMLVYSFKYQYFGCKSFGVTVGYNMNRRCRTLLLLIVSIPILLN